MQRPLDSHALMEPAVSKFSKAVALLALSLSLTAAIAARDPADAEGTIDHPEIVRFPGFHIDSAKTNDYNEFGFATRGLDGSSEPVGGGEAKGGRYWQIVYCLNEEARRPSVIELVRNHENAFRKAGGAMVARHPKSGEPEVAVYKAPREGGAERWAQIHVYNEGGCYRLDIVDTGSMAQKLEFSAGEMADAIRKNGFVALTGILFDTGKDTIKPGSTPLLQEVVAMLEADKGLKLSVEGHTDNVGGKAANLELSRKRALRVVKFLVDAGIEGKRLKADGKGDSAPVADNRTEPGRAKNRRVELVKF